MFNKRHVQLSLITVSLGAICAQPALAQSKFHTPNGHQTAALSPMLQQPTVQGSQPPPTAGTIQDLLSPEKSTVRVGPVDSTPIWVRGMLAAWLLLQFFAMLVCFLALQLRGRSDQIRFQGGKEINEDYREPTLPQLP